MNERRGLLLAPCLGLLAVLALPMNCGWAADPRLDLAYDNLVKAKALVAASEDPGARRPFDGHAQKAMNSIDRAIREVILAKQAADDGS